MPRYFFDRADGVIDPDHEGVELADVQSARVEAVLFAADTLKDPNFAVWDGGTLRIDATDGSKKRLFTIFISIDEPKT